MKNKTEEIWASIEGYEGIYQVSTEGRIKGLAGRKEVGRVGILKEEIIEQIKDPDGYMRVLLTNKDGAAEGVCVHILVAETFIPKPGMKIH